MRKLIALSILFGAGSLLQASSICANSCEFLYNAGSFSIIEVPGSLHSVNGINDAGQIVGTYLSGAYFYGFLDNAGSFTNIRVPKATGPFFYDTQANGIDDAGQIAGLFFDNSGTGHGFLDNAGTFTTIDMPGTNETIALGINDASQIIGVGYISIPEPDSMWLLGSGLAGICALALRKRRCGIKRD